MKIPLEVVWKKKNFKINLNQYRNTHHYMLNKVKQDFIEQNYNEMYNQERIEWTYKLEVVLYLKRKADIDNFWSVLIKFLLDALQRLGKVEEDNCDYFKWYNVEYWWKTKEEKSYAIVNIVKI